MVFIKKTFFNVLFFLLSFLVFSLQAEKFSDDSIHIHDISTQQIPSPEEAFNLRYKKIEPLVDRYSSQDISELLRKADHFSSEKFLYPILHAQEIKQNAMRAFRDKLVYQIDMHGLIPTIPAIGIYTKDILSLLLYGGILLDEKILRQVYHNYIAQLFTNHLITQAQTALPLFSNQKSADLPLATLTPPILQSRFLHVKHLATSSYIANNAWHIALNLFVKACKKHYLLEEENEGISITSQRKSYHGPKPLFSVLQETIFVEIPLNIPDATVINTLIHFCKVNDILPPLCNNLLLQASKDIVVALLFLHYITTECIIPQWHQILRQNQEQFGTLLATYLNPETSPDAQASIKKTMLQIITTGITMPYASWLKQKHRYATQFDGYYYALFLLPVVYKWTILLYNMYKTVTQTTTDT